MRVITLGHDRALSPLPATEIAFVYQQASNPARTLVYDEDGNWLATFTNGARSVALKGCLRTFTEQAQGVADSFGRTRSNGWGPAEKGGVWYTTGSDASDFSVSAGMGHMLCTTAGLARRTSVSNILQNIDATVCVKTSAPAQGAHQIAGIMFAYQDIDNHYLARLRFMPANITDNFTRNTTNGWGNATSGQSWDTSGGSATDYSINGSEGRHSVNAINSSRRTVMSTVDAKDFDIKVKVKSSALASGASQVAAILGRYQDSNNHYIFRARFSSGSSHEIFASIQKNIAGAATLVGSEVTTAFAHTANTYYWIRAQASGTTLRVRIWPDSQAEPSVWDVATTDNTFADAGNIGLRSILQTGSTNTLPVTFTYDDFQATLEQATTDAVDLCLQIRVAGTYTTISPTVILPGISHAGDEWFRLRLQHGATGEIAIRAWKDDVPEPTNWQIQTTNTAYTAGRVGLRSIVNTDTANLPVTFSYRDVAVSGQWLENPQVNHNIWVRLLPSPFNGVVDITWLRTALADISPDVMAIAMQYIAGAPTVTDPAQNNLQVLGHSRYGPLQTDGTRQEGADFNDYLGVTWHYAASPDNPEAAQLQCLDCSGYVRMVFGYRLGVPMSLTADGASLPRVSSAITNNGPGVLIAQATAQLNDFSQILPGDILAFDADTSNPDEEEGQIDHVGLYLGVDLHGKHRFISSRKTANGPTFADVGGPSVVGQGTNLYTRSLRAVRRL